MNADQTTESGTGRPAHPSYTLLTVWLALVAGLIELGVLEFRQHVMHHTIERSRQIVWLTPLSYLILLGVASLGIAAVARLAPRLLPDRVRAFALGTLAAFGPAFLFYPGLAKFAVYILAAGIGVQVSRMATANGPAFARLMRRTTPWLVGIVLGATAILNLGLALEARQNRAVTGTPRAGAPNILLIILDTVRAWNLSVYGYARKTTPHLDRFAARGVRFNRAYSTAPWTLPSHATLFTGRYTRRLKADWLKPMDEGAPTVAEVLRAHGYRTAGFVANFAYTSYEHGLDRGFSTYEDYHASPAELLLYSSLGRFFAMSPDVRRLVGYYDQLDRKRAPEVNAELLSWLRRDHDRDRPFFAFLNYFDAHIPYLPRAPYDTMFGPRRAQQRYRYWMNGADFADRSKLTPDQLQGTLDAYDGSLAWLDAQVGALLDSLTRLGVLDSTVVIVAGDHGEQFGEHGLYDHGNSLYAPLLHVPLFISWPGHVPRERIVEPAITLRDVPATILEFAGIRTGTGIPGTSLARFWDPRPDVVPSSPIWSLVRRAPRTSGNFPSNKGEMRSLVLGDYHYIRLGDGSEEVYDMVRDRLEEVNLVGTSLGDSLLPTLRLHLGPSGSTKAP